MATADRVQFISLRETPCPDDFIQLVPVGPVVEKTRAECVAAIEARVAGLVALAQKRLNCGQYDCDDRDCEFDSMVEYDPPRKIFQATKKHGKKRRWLATATVLIGCFCPGDDDDPEDDPKDDPHGKPGGHGDF